MSNEEKQLLFGEYATGNISSTDKCRLMAAALEDQDLFNAIAEQEELSELTVTLPSHPTQPPPRRNPWPFLFTGAAALALTVTGVFFLRTQTEHKAEVAQAPRPVEPLQSEPAPPTPMRAAKPTTTVLRQDKSVTAPAQSAVRDQISAGPPPEPEAKPAAKTSPLKSTPAPTKGETEPVVVAPVAQPRFQILRRGPTGTLAPAADLQDGDALVVRYVPTQPGNFDLQDLATNTTLATRNATSGQSLDFSFTAVRGTMNLELRPRPPVALAFAETRSAARSDTARSDTARSEVAKERKAAPPPPPSALRLFLTVR